MYNIMHRAQASGDFFYYYFQCCILLHCFPMIIGNIFQFISHVNIYFISEVAAKNPSYTLFYYYEHRELSIFKMSSKNCFK